jgi:uncharacterized protein YraI
MTQKGGLLFAALLLGALALAAPRTASAQELAYSVPGSTNVRAGPGTQFPVVARVRGGVEIYVFGCLSDRAWCDVQVYETRGWMSSRRLEFVYGGSRVLVPEYYSYFDAPIISFNFGYWDRHYRHRPWYRDWRRPPRDHGPPIVGGGPGGPDIEGPGARIRPGPPLDWAGGAPDVPGAVMDPGGAPEIVGGGRGGPEIEGPGALPGTEGGAPGGVCPPDVVCQ